MTREEREAKIASAEEKVAWLKSIGSPMAAEAEARLEHAKEVHRQIIADGESCTHGLPNPPESNLI